MVKTPLHNNHREVLDILNNSNADSLYISRITSAMTERIYGDITRQDIDLDYLPPKQ